MSNDVCYKKYMIGWITLQHDPDCRFRVRALLGFGRSMLELARARSESIFYYRCYQPVPFGKCCG